MKALLLFELSSYFKKAGFYLFLLVIILLGFMVGSNGSMSFGPDIFSNSPYAVAYMTGFLSLLCIFFCTVFAAQILFREKDSHFSLVLYATPLHKKHYLLSRLGAVLFTSFTCYACLFLGFGIGQLMHGHRGLYTEPQLSWYLLPLIVFGLINTIFCSSVVSMVALLTRNKLLVYVTGLFIYILYMVMLIYSRSPMMAHGMPQTAQAAWLSALLDPFGISAFFLQTANWSVVQRNTDLIVPGNAFLLNRIAVLLLSALSIVAVFWWFSFAMKDKAGKRTNAEPHASSAPEAIIVPAVQVTQGWFSQWSSFLSFSTIYIRFIAKSIPLVLTTLGLLFYVAMEIDGHIKGGIRFPQRYATSGLMANRTIGSFHGLCLIVLLYYANEIVWRSRQSNFKTMEDATPASRNVLFFSQWLTLSSIVIFFSTLMVLMGIVFQFIYGYQYFDWTAYGGIYLFNCLPLIVSAGIILLVQQLIKHRYAALTISAAVILFTATTAGKKLLAHPLFQFQMPYNGLYSDMNGFGAYAAYYGWRFLFGAGIVVILSVLIHLVLQRRTRLWVLPVLGFAIAACYWAGNRLSAGYIPETTDAVLHTLAQYEQQYRKLQHRPQPTITAIKTTVHLFPEKNAYEVEAYYTLKNKTATPIHEVLVNVADNISIHDAAFMTGTDSTNGGKHTGVIALHKPLQPNDTGRFYCRFSYHWDAVNGHESFNAIVENGSFMRISRYYPVFGYLSENEISDSATRRRFQLGTATADTPADAPKDSADRFIDLDMTLSTSHDQTAIGVGELVKKWKQGNRNYFQYKTPSPILFRFAVSSAAYALKTAGYRGKQIEVYYHPGHFENVAHLIKNIQLTLDYCEAHFGPYPFSTIRFAEVSAFTKGFAGTAYPATIFMTEDMVFHTNIKADRQQDLINELAGHELAHIWWGNSQIAPDNREGNVLLTETLAMYTELMLVKKMHGAQRVIDNVQMHLGMYRDGRGYTEEQPLVTMQSQNTHLSYSKGMVVMYQLSMLIGEEKVNLALKQFLQKHRYPAPGPVAADLIGELYAVTDTALHSRIDDLFKKITFYEFKPAGISLTRQGARYKLSFAATAGKYYDDGKGRSTPAPFSDTVEMAIVDVKGKETLWKLPAANNRLSGIILLDAEPRSVLIDPRIQFIQRSETEPIPLGK